MFCIGSYFLVIVESSSSTQSPTKSVIENESSVFQQMGLHKNDVIKKINGKEVDSKTSTQEIAKLLSSHKAVEILILRDGKEKTIKLD